MKNRNLGTIGTMINRLSVLTELFSARKSQYITSNLLMVVMMTLLLSLTGRLSIAADSAPMTPELAAKKEMVRKQEGQRITPEKRKTAAEALKAERMKVHKARKATQQSIPAAVDNK
jgi:hypothetical protein